MSPATGAQYVVVGGGAAGVVMAARLAESGREVLLLEAGPDLRGATPATFRDGWGIDTGESSWGYRSEQGPRGNIQTVARTKALGGTSWMTRFAVRGAPGDYDAWQDAGNAGWGFDDVLPYLKRIESDTDFGSEDWHGDRGPMPVDRYPGLERSDLVVASMSVWEELGFKPVADHNRPGAVGVGPMPFSTRDGKRVTTLDAYLGDATPANLTIRTGAEVDKVVRAGGRARGVRLADGEEIDAAHVVLCAGVYGDPPILLRSGIGPAEHLRALGIEVAADLPGVGENLADHPVVDLDYGEQASGRAQILHYLATYRSSASAESAPPDMAFWGADPEDVAFELAVVLLKPRSRGSVRLRSADPRDAPVIDLPALEDPVDHERLVDGLERALTFANHPDIRALVGPPPTPPDLGAHVYEVARSLPHVVGTCAMGPRPEDGAVVDAAGRVHGVDCLTIADASIMPDVPSGFTHFPTIMIAERLAERLAK